MTPLLDGITLEQAITCPTTGFVAGPAARLILGRRLDERAGLLVTMIDVDGLKAINDTRGHHAGDQHLAAVADAIRRQCRRGRDTVIRVGGDEFVVLHDVHPDQQPAIEARLRRALGRIASVGTGTCPDEADERMYEHKRAKKAGNRWATARRNAEAPASGCDAGRGQSDSTPSRSTTNGIESTR